MTLIRIEECLERAGSANAKLSFDYGEEYPLTISDPFSEKQEQELEWYFERHIYSPFTDGVRAQDAANSISTYGETLFKQVFSDPDVHARYEACLSAGLDTLQIEIVGNPTFHRWHWEALKDPAMQQAIALHTTIVRKHTNPALVNIAVRPSPTINLLLVIARPSDRHDVGYRTISRPVVESLRQANLPINIYILRPGTYRALVTHLDEMTANYGAGYYHAIHFDVHGALYTFDMFKLLQKLHGMDQGRYGRDDLAPYEGEKAFLSLEGERDGTADLVEASELADLLLTHQIPIAILNACQSGKQVGASETSLGSRLLQAGVQMVLAMGYSITVSAASILMSTLYRELFAGQDLSTAIRRSRQELASHKGRRAAFNWEIDLEDWLLPVVYQIQPLHLHPRPFTPEEETEFSQRKLHQYSPSEPLYGFVGRDLDIVHLEKRLLVKRNIVLVRGMGGAGKTTLLHHLGMWWQTTGFVEHVFYFGYDDRAWSYQQIFHVIAQQLLGKEQYEDTFLPMPIEVQQTVLAEQLYAQRHLLILDNMESITGVHLAIQHTLSLDEQTVLHSFLKELVGGRTLVLLGSRSCEDWLANETFADNVYDLPGLDPEAASTLADLILKRHNAIKYRQDADMYRLITLLDGFPLALEVVLANLAQQTPTEVLEALQAGDVKIDPKSDSTAKTESILRCIEYSYSNLSQEAQQLLICLAPFTSVIYVPALDSYMTRLQQQSPLSSLPFNRWSEVIEDAKNWGLLSPDPNFSSFLRLQPILPYFLRTRLYDSEQAEIRRVVEKVFRERYDQVGRQLYDLLHSEDVKKRLMGQVVSGLEYENLVMGLNLALAAQVSILNMYMALSAYLDTTQDHQRGLELAQAILHRLEEIPADKLTGGIGLDADVVIDGIARRQLLLKHFTAAEASYHKALDLLVQLKEVDEHLRSSLIASTYRSLGRIAEEKREWTEAELHYQQALQTFTDLNDRHEQASIYHQLCIVAQEQLRWEQAEQYCKQALQIYTDLNEHHELAGTYHELGTIAAQQRQWELAKQYCKQALRLKIVFQDHYAQATTYALLGTIATQQEQWEQAKQYYQQALKIFIAFDDRHQQAKMYLNLGHLSQYQEQWEQAKQYYQQALKIFIAFDDRHQQADVYNNLGVMAVQQQQWEQAEQNLQLALQIYIDADEQYTQARIYYSLGITAMMQGRWKHASDYSLQALKTFVQYNDTPSSTITLQLLAQLWQIVGEEDIPKAIGSILGMTQEEIAMSLRRISDSKFGETS